MLDPLDLIEALTGERPAEDEELPDTETMSRLLRGAHCMVRVEDGHVVEVMPDPTDTPEARAARYAIWRAWKTR